MNKKFIYGLVFFFTPIIGLYLFGEYHSYLLFDEQRTLVQRINKSSILVTGSSQLREAVIPCQLSSEALDLSFGNKQHLHDRLTMDYLRSNYPGKIKVVILELSYEHLEVPHRTKKSRQNYMYRFYDAKTNNKPYGPWNNLLFYKRPSVMFKRYLKFNRKRKEVDAAEYCYEYFRPGPGKFDLVNHQDPLIVEDIDFFEQRPPNPQVYRKNLDYLLSFLQELEEDQIVTIIVITPKHETYIRNMNSEIRVRRDRAIQIIKERFPKIRFVNKELDTTNYKTADFKDHNHLNNKGAQQFTRSLDSTINQLLLENDIRLK
ncbi:hypothetical protein [Aureitalea marina]|uniref:hypothetical protein n=1 Tax=Aureitalea marina TaxID=930804 RepID=UPI0011B07AE5|nr:hypothetical protein [Aureitalea marina]